MLAKVAANPGMAVATPSILEFQRPKRANRERLGLFYVYALDSDIEIVGDGRRGDPERVRRPDAPGGPHH
jgi:hypothetical protein